MIRILIADDHTMFRAGLRRLLEQEDNMEIIGEADNGRDAVEMAKRLSPDVILLDISMPDMDGFETARRLAKGTRPYRVLVLTMHDNADYASVLLHIGVRGYLLKGNSPRELVEAVRTVAGGNEYVTPSIKEQLLCRSDTDKTTDPTSVLSEREIQIFLMLAQGKSSKQICQELTLSPSTVGTHKKRIMDKLKVDNMSELVRLALNAGLIQEK